MSEVIAEENAIEELYRAFKTAFEITRLIRSCGEHEIQGLLKALRGGFIEPGPSGSLTRGKIDVLPTGRNFYAVDPTQLPTPEAWRIGVESAERLLEYYRGRYGRYPECIGEVLWSIDAYKADGEQLSRILWLLGVEPIWAEDGSVIGVKPVPLERLGRPRIDVVVRISGIVRDTLPNYIRLIDEAVNSVIQLDEPLEMNYVKKHYLEVLRGLRDLGIDNAEERAKARVYGEPPGAYGAGVNYAIEASAWRTKEDLAKVWLQWGSHAYSGRFKGEINVEAFILQLRKVEIIARNHVSDEHTLLDCCCYYAFQGGFAATVKAVSDRDPEIVVVDTRDVSDIRVRDVKLEIERTVISRLLNPKWIEEMKRHGYRGAAEIQKMILHLYGWAAISGKVSNWVFQKIAETYVFNEENKRWLLENNIYAFEEIVRRLIEAAYRGVWNADERTFNRLNEVYSEVESLLEGEAGEGAQGGSIDIYAPEDVKEWRDSPSMSRVLRAFEKIVGRA